MMNKIKTALYLSSFISLSFLITSCTGRVQPEVTEQLQVERDSLAEQLEAQQHTIDSLLENASVREEDDGYPILFGRDFRNIENPEEFISNSLREQPELIPLEAVLGGTMAFRKIDILSEKWVMAIYDDGHVQGQAIYEYRLLPDESLEFSLRIYDHP